MEEGEARVAQGNVVRDADVHRVPVLGLQPLDDGPPRGITRVIRVQQRKIGEELQLPPQRREER